MYRNRLLEESLEEDKENVHDDKSTVILNPVPHKHPQKKEKEPESHNLARPNVNYYSSLVQEARSAKKDLFSKSKKTVKNPTSSMPSEVIVSQEHKTNPLKNASISKYPGKGDSPVASQVKLKKIIEPEQ